MAATAQTSTAPRRPPRAFFTYVVNPTLRTLLRTRWGAQRIGKVLMLLTFRGRRSGRTFTTPVGYHREGDTLTTFTHSPWWRNLEGGAPVTVLVTGQTYQGRAEVLTDFDTIYAYMKEAFSKEGAQAQRRLGLSLTSSAVPTDEELRQIIQEQRPVMIRTHLQ